MFFMRTNTHNRKIDVYRRNDNRRTDAYNRRINSNKKRKKVLRKRKAILRIIFLSVFCVVLFYFGRTIANLDLLSNNTEIGSNIPASIQINTNKAKRIINTNNDTNKSDSSTWNLILVNNDHLIDEDFEVTLTSLKNGHSVDSRIYDDLQKMMNDARKNGLSPLICSSYRTYEKQSELYNEKVDYYKGLGYSEEESLKKAANWVAAPGTSEHQLGLAVDIVSLNYQMLNDDQENTKEQKWLMEHCHEYGFILRYPKDKIDITQVGYEPWHYRYVGYDAAKEITEKGLCLEEYLEQK